MFAAVFVSDFVPGCALETWRAALALFLGEEPLKRELQNRYSPVRFRPAPLN
jgi:hypothetical protein